VRSFVGRYLVVSDGVGEVPDRAGFCGSHISGARYGAPFQVVLDGRAVGKCWIVLGLVVPISQVRDMGHPFKCVDGESGG